MRQSNAPAREVSLGQSPTGGLCVVFLGSGSRGNAAAVSDGTTTLLVDCGFSEREATRRLLRAGIAPASVSALLVTHEHGDHVSGVAAFACRYGCPVLATRGTRHAAGLPDSGADFFGDLVAGREVRVGTLAVLPFATSHDAAEPVGVRIEDANGCRFGLATDTGVLTQQAAEALVEVDFLGLETNHDLAMLERGPYPGFLKRRIRSSHGHLSNADASEAIARLASDRLRRVFALHRSETNNTPLLAGKALTARLAALGLNVPVEVVKQNGAVEVVSQNGAVEVVSQGGEVEVVSQNGAVEPTPRQLALFP